MECARQRKGTGGEVLWPCLVPTGCCRFAGGENWMNGFGVRAPSSVGYFCFRKEKVVLFLQVVRIILVPNGIFCCLHAPNFSEGGHFPEKNPLSTRGVTLKNQTLC